MPNEHALIGLVGRAALDECPTHADGAAPLPAAEDAAVHRPRARVLRIVARRAVGRVTHLLRLWHRRIAESDELWAMSDRELRDIGLSRYDAEHAARKALWKASWERR